MDAGQIQKAEQGEFRPRDVGKLAHVDHADLLERIASGEYVPAIAASLNVTKQAISYRLRKVAPDAYRLAREIGCEVRLHQSREALEAANDALDLARAREAWRADTWFAEREFSDRWGAKQQVDMRVRYIDLADRLGRAAKRVRGRVIDQADAPRHHNSAKAPDSDVKP